MAKRIGKLERELARKERRALAEAATLLVLRVPLAADHPRRVCDRVGNETRA